MRTIMTWWKCDRCQEEVMSVGSNSKPKGWIAIASNPNGVDPAWDHGDWLRMHLCPGCVEDFVAFQNKEKR